MDALDRVFVQLELGDDGGWEVSPAGARLGKERGGSQLTSVRERPEATTGEREHEAVPRGAVVRASPRGVPDSPAPTPGPRAGSRRCGRRCSTSIPGAPTPLAAS
jgi:hypothetical protein